MTFSRLIAFVAVLSFAIASPSVLGCSCTEYLALDPEAAFEKSDLVFAGKVESIEVVILPVRYFTMEGGAWVPSQKFERRGIVRFRVEKDWKGESPETYAILAAAPPEGPSCSNAYFEEGVKYLVFASGVYPEADPCAPTGELKPDDPFVRRLDAYVAKKSAPRPPAKKPD